MPLLGRIWELCVPVWACPSECVPVWACPSWPFASLGLVLSPQLCAGNNACGGTLLQPSLLRLWSRTPIHARSATGVVGEHACALTKESLGDHYGSPAVEEQEPP